MIMTIAKRLNELCRIKGVRKAVLAEKIGVPQSTMQTWIARDEDFPARFVVPISRILGVSPVYLLTGEESPDDLPLPPLPEDEMSLLTLYRSLPREGRVMVECKAIEEVRRTQESPKS